MQKIHFVFLLLTLFSANLTFADSGKTINVAIIVNRSSGLDKSPLIPLLEVEISKMENIKLLERSEIERVLAEKRLQLSLGTEENQNRQLIGNTLGAEVILFIDKFTDYNQNEWIRTRIVETRTGIIFDDLLIASSGLDEDIKTWIETVRTQLAKVNAPLNQRYYLGISDIRNEELGSELNQIAAILTNLVSHDLNTSTDVVILERKQLNYLLNERNLSEIDVQLRASTVILEGGVRRKGNNDDLSVSFRFVGLTGRNIQGSSLDVSMSDILAARKKICQAIVSILDKTLDFENPTDTKMEAIYFLNRAILAESGGLSGNKTAFAETALALDEDNIVLRRKVFKIYKSFGSKMFFGTSNIDKFNAYKRAHEINLETLKKISHLGSQYLWRGIVNDISVQPSDVLNGLPKPANKQEKQIESEIYSLCQKELETLYDLYQKENKGPSLLIYLLRSRLRNAFQEADNTGSFGNEIKSLIAEYECISQNLDDTDQQKISFYDSLAECFNPQRNTEHKEQIRPLLEWLSEQSDSKLRLIACYGMHDLEMLKIDQAIDILNQIFSSSQTNSGGLIAVRNNIYTSLAPLAVMKLQKSGQMESFFDNILEQAEQSKSSYNIVNRSAYVGIVQFLRNAEKEKQYEWIRRISALMDSYPVPLSMQQRAKEIRQFMSTFLPNRVISDREIDRRANYIIIPIHITERQTNIHVYPEWIHIEKQNQKIIIVWRSQVKKQEQGISLYDYVVTSMDAKGGTLKQIGKLEDLQDITIKCSADGADNIFFGTDNLGLIVINSVSSEIYSETNGCPFNEVSSMAYLDNTLYLGFEGALAKFNLKTKTFDIIGSSKSVQIKNDLDGGKTYRVSNILPDSEQNLLWLSVYNHKNNDGIWRYNPVTGDLNFICRAYPSWINLNDKGEIIFVDSYQLFLLDPQTCKTRRLENYKDGSANIRKGFVMLGNDIFVPGNLLLSNDGNVNKFETPWNYMELCGSGIIAASFDVINNRTDLTLSFIQPNEPVENNLETTTHYENSEKQLLLPSSPNTTNKYSSNQQADQDTNDIVAEINKDDLQLSLMKEFISQLSTSQEIEQKGLDLAEKYIQQKKYTEAFTLYQIVLENSSEPNQAIAAYAGIAISGIKLGQKEAVKAAIAGLLEKNIEVKTYKVINEIAQKCTDAQMFESADKLSRYIIEKQPQSHFGMNAHIGLVKNYFAQDRLNDANNALVMLIKNYMDNPQLPRAIHVLGEEYYYYQSPAYKKELQSGSESRPISLREIFKDEFENKYTKSRMVWMKAIELMSDNPLTAEYYHYAGTCSRELGEYENALKYYQIVIDKYPDYKGASGVQLQIAHIYESLENEGLISVEEAYDLVINAYQEIINKYPNSSFVNLAKNRIGRCKQEFQRKLEKELRDKMGKFQPANQRD